MSRLPVPFFKMVATGNDFIVVDNRKKIVSKPADFAKKVCRPHLGAGADGLLLLEASNKAEFKMRILNADGSEAEACGNGFRCIAQYAVSKLNFPRSINFESLSGLIRAEVRGRKVRIQLNEPREYRASRELIVQQHRIHYSFINTGVPHAVIFVNGLDKIDVNTLGRAIRYHDDFSPKGTNVNFVEVKGKHQIDVRTYERGVEQETLACGTGSTASALISSLAGYTVAPVEVNTRGGDRIKIDFKQNDSKMTCVTLEGNADFVYEGKWLQ